MKVPAKYEAAYNHLLELRDGILKGQTDLAKDAIEEQPSYSLHMADAGTDSYDRDFALSMISSRQDAVYEIEQAIDRIRNGTYGICEVTGKPIDPRRLEAQPWTRFSAEAKRELEREGKAETQRRQLAQRENLPRESTLQTEETD